jgi:hypothetical protein
MNPRFVVTVALLTDPLTGECPEAELLERHLIENLHPSENIAGRIESESVAAETTED